MIRMKNRIAPKMIALLLILATLMTALPLRIFAEEIRSEAEAEEETYIRSVKLTKAKTRAEAKEVLEAEGYIFLEGNLNEGTGQTGIWLGYQTTTDPTEAIYDMKVMNMNGGFTLTSMKEALASQEAVFAEMARDLNLLIEEFVQAYEEGSVPAQKAYTALNFFRVVDEREGESAVENGLGYRIVHGDVTLSTLTEILLFCNSDIVDSIVKILTMGIQARNENWMQQLSEKGPYEDDTVYMEDEAELKRRAEQLLLVLDVYAEAYNAMVKSELMPDRIDSDFNAMYDSEGEGDVHRDVLTAEESDMQKLDDNRYKFYKLVTDELAKYRYGKEGTTLKDFFCSLADEGNAKALYPLVSVLTDGEFAALSYGCFLEVATGATATSADFDTYDAVFTELTAEVSSVYLYAGVDKALFDEDAIVGFTDTAQRHMASTGELEFFEKDSSHEAIWKSGIRVAKCIGAAGLAVIGVTKVAMGTVMVISAFSATVASAAKTGILACMMKFCAVISGPYAMLVTLAAVVLVVTVSYIVAVIDEWWNGKIDWEDNPMPKYLYDVKEVSFCQTSDDGIATELMKRPVFALYEAVTDLNGELVDLNARSKDASQWIELFVSYDRQGEDAQPIKAEDLMVKTGDGTTPDGYAPLSRFGEVIAYNLNQWDEDDDVNGVYVFYKQDQTVAVESGKTYYVYDVYLQVGESDTHCIELLKAAGYTPINVNLSPDLDDGDYVFNDKVYTYIGYKVTTNPSNAIRDIRMVYGPGQGEINYGATTYAECGSNGAVTLYATKYAAAGTPLLAGGLICVDDRSKAPVGYEPVCTMAGGPAVSFNTNNGGVVFSDSNQLFLYFLPETTFTSGTQYVGDIAFFYAFNSLADVQDTIIKALDTPESVKKYWNSYTQIAGTGKYIDSVAYYATYNPYRAVYGIGAAMREDLSNTLVFENLGYVAWNRINWGYVVDTGILFDILKENANAEELDFSILYANPAENMNGAIYLMGNPNSANTYDAAKNQMSKVQPLTVTDVICWNNTTIPDSYTPVTDIFTFSEDAARLEHERGQYCFDFYVNKSEEKRPYVSNILAIDELTLFRAYGGYDKGLKLDTITDTMMLSQLASRGATNFNSYRVSLRQTDVWDGGSLYDSYDEINALRFGYTRTANKSEALRDVFLYYNGFSNDEPPKEIYRGSTKYTLLCEIPYNLTGYNSAPKTGVYLYGTTDSKAGERIIDFEVSGTPFMEGYTTVRTMNGRSLVGEIMDHVDAQRSSHPMAWGQILYNFLYFFFNTDDEKQENGYFYLHIKREGDDLQKQKPYIGEFYLASCNEDTAAALDDLFDQGAEGYVDLDMNKGAGGDYVYVGYSYTADPDDAIKEIRAYHKKNPPATVTDSRGSLFTLVRNLDLNQDAGGDYIYLYVTKESTVSLPIISLSAGYKVVTGEEVKEWVDGSQQCYTTECTKMWNADKYSDLNKGAGGEYIYLTFTTIGGTFHGTYTEPNYGKDKTYTRKEFEKQSATGKYIGGLYVMDKNTILQERIADGTLPAGSACTAISDQDVFARLKAMGATAVIETPIQVDSGGYFENNQNKVFLGYSRTDEKSKAITNIAIKAEILSLAEPKDKIEVNGKSYTLVAEAAKKVTELPRAINLIGLENGQDLLLPRFYLYYSTSGGSDPIYDICIDGDPIKNGWNTVRSAGLLDPFADVYYQAYEQYELANKDDKAFYDSEIVYTDPLFEWMDDVADLFDPEDAEATPFYIHVKRYAEATIETVKPYIGEVFVAKGDSKHEALSKLIAFEPDGFIDVDLNQNAGGNYVYMAYKRVAKEKDALTDIMVYEGEKYEPTRRLTVGENTVKFSLVADVDLNSEAGGKYLYLYTTDSKYTGNPITSLGISASTDAYLKCGVERVTVKRAEGKAFTDEYIDLNKGAGGDYLYLVMTRTTTEGHTSNGIVLYERDVSATCLVNGYHSVASNCADCGAHMETVTRIYEACGHTPGEREEKVILAATADKDGVLKLTYRCTVCGEIVSESTVTIPAGSESGGTVASLFGNGSVYVILAFAGIAVAAAIAVWHERRKTTNITNQSGEDKDL